MHLASISIQEFEIDLDSGLPTEVGTQHLSILYLGLEEAREVVLSEKKNHRKSGQAERRILDSCKAKGISLNP